MNRRMKSFSFRLRFQCCLILLACLPLPVAAAAPLPSYGVELPHRASVEDLANTSNIVAYGRFDTAHHSKTLRKQVDNGTLVNYGQNFHVMKYVKGSGPMVVEVLSTGIEPMPDPSDDWNAAYPGPMAEGEYVCFLTRIDNAYYALNGRWQGAYPIDGGKTIALEGSGFPELGGLTVQQLEAKLRFSP
ncbi:hypothetical protein MO973_43370 [Paenibacillus sp. TRM 82003]|nr:hypothetical protein [Paenibacillus sp. TRM 82003]